MKNRMKWGHIHNLVAKDHKCKWYGKKVPNDRYAFYMTLYAI